MSKLKLGIFTHSDPKKAMEFLRSDKSLNNCWKLLSLKVASGKIRAFQEQEMVS